MRRLKLYRGIWCAVDRVNGRTTRVSLRTDDRETAERRFKDFRPEIGGETIAEIVALYLQEKAQAPSVKSMETAWRAIKPVFGHLRPDQITRDLCRKYAASRKKGGVTDGTVIKDLGFLRSAVLYSKKGDKSLFWLPPSPPPRDRYLSREEYARLLAACVLPHTKLFVILALATAGRAAAVLELTWDRVDFDRGQIRLSAATGRRKGRATVPITKPAREALEEAARVRETEYVIEYGGQRVRSLKRTFATACRNAGLEDVSPHVLRHTSAVWMAEAGVAMTVIAQYLGHTDSRITERVYGRYSPGYLKAAAKALETF